jgi:hypothetical protein
MRQTSSDVSAFGGSNDHENLPNENLSSFSILIINHGNNNNNNNNKLCLL